MGYDPATAWEYECRRRERQHKEWRSEVCGHILVALGLLGCRAACSGKRKRMISYFITGGAHESRAK